MTCLTLTCLFTHFNVLKYLDKWENCRADVGFLVDQSASLTREGWQATKDFVLSITKSLGIAEDGAHVALTTFHGSASLRIKFSDHTNYTSFEKAIYALPDKLGGSTNTFAGFNVTLNEMFTELNGMRKDAPHTLLYMTDGECFHISGRYPNGSAIIPLGSCSDSEFHQWKERFDEKDVKRYGIGVGTSINVTEIEMFVGTDNIFQANTIGEILSPEFLRNLSVCDGNLFLFAYNNEKKCRNV